MRNRFLLVTLISLCSFSLEGFAFDIEVEPEKSLLTFHTEPSAPRVGLRKRTQARLYAEKLQKPA